MLLRIHSLRVIMTFEPLLRNPSSSQTFSSLESQNYEEQKDFRIRAFLLICFHWEAGDIPPYF